MPTSVEALNILVFLIPGFISSAVLNTFAVRKGEQKELQRIVEALIFSMLVYAVYSLFGRSPISLNQQNVPIYDPISLLLLIAFSLAFPLLLSLFITNDWHMRFARWANITRKTSRPSTWYDVFSDENRNIVVNFEDGSRICGWPKHYSDDPEEPYIYLTNPHKVDGNKLVDTGFSGILITPEMKIEYIEFLKDPKEQLERR